MSRHPAALVWFQLKRCNARRTSSRSTASMLIDGRGWRGFHHQATLCIAAYVFLVAERSHFSRSARVGQLELPRHNSRMKDPLTFTVLFVPCFEGGHQNLAHLTIDRQYASDFRLCLASFKPDLRGLEVDLIPPKI